MHILSCLGSGVSYSPFKCQPSNLQLLRARQGFKERIRTVQMSWVRGAIDDQSAALISCAALLEELTSGWASGIEVLDQAFAMVLPGIFSCASPSILFICTICYSSAVLYDDSCFYL